VDASVTIAEDFDPGALPPLPVHLRCGSVAARGALRGCWTIAQVREAEERGELTVDRVHQFAFAPETRPLFAELADLFAEFPKELSKRLYTRFWGKFGSRGGYQAHISDEPVVGEVPATGMWWKYDGIDLCSYHARRTYRPDLAAFIAAANHRHVMSTMRTLEPDSVVACHVDAIWTTDVVGAVNVCDNQIGGWRVKRRGPIRFFGTGCYDHDGHLAAAGYDANHYGRLTRQRLEDWVCNTTYRRLLLETRRWNSDPATDGDATSVSLCLRMDREMSPTEGPPVHDSCWTPRGWMRQVDTEPGEPVREAA